MLAQLVAVHQKMACDQKWRPTMDDAVSDDEDEDKDEDEEDDENDGDGKARKRTDRAIRLAQRRLMQETVVKAKLSVLPGSYDKELDRQAMLQAIDERVKAVSRRSQLASVALLLWIRKQTKDVPDAGLANVDMSHIFKQTFFRQLMLGTEDAVRADERVKSLHAEYPQLVITGGWRFPGDRNLYSSATNAYLSNLRNHLRFNIKLYTNRVLYAMQEQRNWNKNEVPSILFSVMGWPTKGLGTWFPMRLEAHRIVESCRSLLKLRPSDVVDEVWLKNKKNHPKVLMLYVFLARKLEQLDAKLFNLVPVLSIRRHFVTIDNSVLHGLLNELVDEGRASMFRVLDLNSLTDDGGGSDFMRNVIWRLAFDVDKLQGRDKTFSWNIQTDGVSMCVHFTQPKRESVTYARQEDARDFSGYRVLGLDPGRTNIYYIVEVLPDGKLKVYCLTRKHYHTVSGISDAIRQSHSWLKNIRSVLERLSTVTTKGQDVDCLLDYLEVLFELQDQLWGEFFRPRWANQRLRSYGGKKRAFDAFWTSVKSSEDKRPIIVAYGAAKFAPTGRGEIAVPTTRAYKECARRFETRPTDEYLTSKKDCETGQVLNLVKKRIRGPSRTHMLTPEQERAAKKYRLRLERSSILRGLLWCGSTKQEGRFVNRDKNAALNIRKCFLAPERPEALRRQPRVKQRVVHSIRTFRASR